MRIDSRIETKTAGLASDELRFIRLRAQAGFIYSMRLLRDCNLSANEVTNQPIETMYGQAIVCK
jgi:hypothetical protein